MMSKGLPLLAVLALVCCTIVGLGAPASGAVSGDPDIYMPGQDALFTPGSVPIMVAGVIHSVDVTLDAPSSNVTVVFHAGTTPPATQNDTNFYTWACRNGVFSDVEHGMYINLSQCSVVAANTYKFGVGMSARAVAGAWMMTIFVDGAQDSAFDVQVRPWRSCRTRAPRFLTILSRRRDACQGFESNPSGVDTPAMKPDEIPWTNVLCGKKA